MNRTRAAWALFFAGYIILMIADRAAGLSYAAFQGAVYALLVPAAVLLYQGTRGKGRVGLRVLLTITHLWLGYALAALIWLIAS